MINISKATTLFSQGRTLQLNGNELVICSHKERIYRFFSPDHHCQQIKAIAAFIEKKLQEAQNPEEKGEYLRLADAFVKRHGTEWYGGKIVQAFDRTIAQHRPNVGFAHPVNQVTYQKWLRNGYASEIYQKYPQFCTFLETSGLLSQMKVTRDTILEIEGEPAILVEGEWTKWSTLQTLFEPRASKQYGERFIVHKQTADVYTYLDNTKGLQKHHPYVTENTPISTLTDEDYRRVIENAHTFIRPGEEHLSPEERQRLNSQRTFVLQLVTSAIEGPDTRLHDLVLKPKHPYLRVVVGADNLEQDTRKGEVYEVGFGWKRISFIPLIASQGQFRSPDVWEYGHCAKRIVTNIPISQDEARALRQYSLKYHRDGVNLGNSVAFHLTRQNCSTYVRHAMAVAGVEAPTEIGLGTLIHDISPEWIAKVEDFFDRVSQGTARGIKHAVSLLPNFIRKGLTVAAEKISFFVHRMFEAIKAFAMVPFYAILGGVSGEGGKAFVQPDEPEKHIGPTLANWRNWFTLSTYQINLPGVLQRWQRQQASTVVYDKPVKLTIVP